MKRAQFGFFMSLVPDLYMENSCKMNDCMTSVGQDCDEQENGRILITDDTLYCLL